MENPTGIQDAYILSNLHGNAFDSAVCTLSRCVFIVGLQLSDNEHYAVLLRKYMCTYSNKKT